MSRLIFVFLATAIVTPVPAQDEAEAKTPDPKPQPLAVESSDTIRIAGEPVSYDATVGWLIMENEKDEPIARFGYTAYSKRGVDELSQRPIMFAFNGGPGSSSIWLHMGILGPKRVVVTDEGFSPPPPAEYVDNEYSIIDVTDLVMVDPVGTGFSKPLGEAEGKQFWGVDQDIKSVGAFIKKYVTENGRWGSPKYILGESYGGIRAAGLVHHLQSKHNMNFNGVIVVSPFLAMGSGADGSNIDLPHVLFLPTLAATAWYHDRLDEKPEDFEAFVAEVEEYAYGPYASALLKGYTIDPEEQAEVAEQLAAFTGTSPDYWIKADLRVSHQQFLQELARDDEMIAGRIDSRFTGPAVNPLAESMDYDPFFPSVGPAYTAAFFDYLRNDLEFEEDEEYKVSAWPLDWDWKHAQPGSNFPVPWPDLRPDLAMAMTMNPNLHLLVQQGYFDLATPTLATKHDLNHLDIPTEARERIDLRLYGAGHMMYLHGPSLEQFREDLAGFIRETDRVGEG